MNDPNPSGPTEGRGRPGAPTTSLPLAGSPRGAAVAMVIMSPLSELTDTDGFEMHSASQRAPALPAPPVPGSVRPLCAGCWVTPEWRQGQVQQHSQPAALHRAPSDREGYRLFTPTPQLLTSLLQTLNNIYLELLLIPKIYPK